MKKRLKNGLTMWVAVLMLLTLLPARPAHAESYTAESDFIFDAASGKIYGYYNNSNVVNIPPTIGGVPVTGIGAYAFERYDTITSVTIPAGVVSIGDCAFTGCDSLGSVTFMGAAPSMESSVFDSSAIKVYYPYGASDWSNPWNGLQTVARCTVTYDSRGGSTVANAVVDAGSVISEPAAPTKENASFGGWYKESSMETLWNFDGDAVTENITLYAQWPGTFSLTYDLDDGAVSPANPTSYTVESDAITLSNPTKTGYTFTGWSGTDITGTSTSVTIPKGSTGNRSYTAHWATVTYTLTYDLDGGAVSPANPASYTSESDAVTLNNPTKAGYTFTGWSGTGITGTSMSVTIPQGSAGNRAYTAHWTAVSTTGTITGTVTNGISFVSGANVSLTVSGSVYSATTAANGSYSITNVPAGTGYTVIASKSGCNSASVANVNVTASITTSGVNFTLTVVSGEAYFTFDAASGTITGYDPTGGTAVSIPTTIGGVPVTSIGDNAFYDCNSLSSITIPAVVTSIGDYAFYDCNSLGSITIPAGVTSIGDYAVCNCSGLTGAYFLGAPPSMGSRVFDGPAIGFKVYYPYGVLGWSNPWNGYPTTARCTVSYDSQGGSTVASVIVNTGDLISQPATPSWTGYTFGGWYSDQDRTNAFNFATPITGNITLYAKWPMPNRKAGVPATATAGVTVNTAYTLNLATIFEDADSNPLTYKVSVNGAADTGANANYSYIPATVGDTTLVFKANDGTVDSIDTYTVILTANPVTHTVAISANPAAGGSVTGGGTYSEGGSVTVTATPNSGYTFVNWAESSNPVSSNAAYTFTLGASDRNLVANFAAIPTYTVGIGTLSGGDIIADQTSAPSGTAINLTLTPDPGRQLKAGTLKYNDGTNNYTISGTSFTMPTANVTVTAEFEAAPQVILDTGGEDGQALLPPGTTDLQLGANSVLDLANGLQTASGGNITVGGQSQSMNSFTGGNLSNVDLTVPQNVGGLAVQLEKAVRLESGTNNQPITITNSGLAGVSASIPDGTTILAPATWNGNMNPPRQVASTGTAPSGFSVGNTVIEVGAADAILLFDKPVTLTLQGVIGTVGYKPAGSNNWVQITQQAGGTYANPSSPVFPGEAYISNGTDTKIITYHLTAFAGLVSAPPPYEPPAWYSVSGVSLDKTTLSFNVGDASSTLKASIQPNYASNPTVTWSSSEPSVARVNGGVVTPVGVGKSIITATTIDGQKTAICTVIVTPSPGKNDQWDERKAEQSVAGDKTWRIKFSKAISPESINRQNIMVLDSKNEPVEIEVKSDVVSDSIILVTPKVPYTKGEGYRLFLGVGLKSLAGKSLTKGIMYSFTVK